MALGPGPMGKCIPVRPAKEARELTNEYNSRGLIYEKIDTAVKLGNSSIIDTIDASDDAELRSLGYEIKYISKNKCKISW